MTSKLPDLSRFEMQVLRVLWTRGSATVRDLQADLPESPGYSTVRKIVERLEEKGAVERVRLDGKAWVYRSSVPASGMIRKEIRRFLDALFDGSAQPLMAHLAEMDAVSLDDLREIEGLLGEESSPPSATSEARPARRSRSGEKP